MEIKWVGGKLVMLAAHLTENISCWCILPNGIHIERCLEQWDKYLDAWQLSKYKYKGFAGFPYLNVLL